MNPKDAAPRASPPETPEAASGRPNEAPTTVQSAGQSPAFRGLSRELTDDELQSPGARKLVLEILGRAEAECERLRGFVDKYYSTNTRAEVLDNTLNASKSFDILFSVVITVAGAMIGLSPSLGWGFAPIVVAVLGVVLLAGAVVAKIRK